MKLWREDRMWRARTDDGKSTIWHPKLRVVLGYVARSAGVKGPQLDWWDYEIPVKVPGVLTIGGVGQWKLFVCFLEWRLHRGRDWPEDWADRKPVWPGPIIRAWNFGPVRLMRFYRA